MIILGYIAAVLMGMVLGVMGGGGAILTVPILVYLMGITPDIATGYSLLIVGATAAFGAVRYFKEGLVDIKASILFAVPSIITVYLSRAYLMPAIPETISFQSLTIDKNLGIMVLFAALMLASATMMLKRAYSQPTPTTVLIEKRQPNVGLIIVEGAVVGVIAGMLGAGGGFLIIPALVLVLRMPMKNAVGTSLFIIALNSILGFIGDLQAGIQLEVPLLPLMLVSTFTGMALSRKIADKLDGAALQKFFAFFILVIAVVIMTRELL